MAMTAISVQRCDQIIDLDLRAEAPVEQAQDLGAIGGDAGLTAEEGAQDQRRGCDEFGDAERDHRKGRTGAPRRHPAEQHGEDQARRTADQRHQRQRDRKLVLGDDVDGVDREEAAEAVIDRVAERQHAGLAEQDIVGQREDDRDADQAEGGQRSARREQFRQHQQHQRRGDPDAVEFQPVGRGRARRRDGCGCVAHVSRVPRRPIGRKIRISTSSR